MLGRFLLLLSFVSLVLIGAMTISCGSSSNSNNKTCTGGPYKVVGPWQLSATNPSGSLTAFGAIDSAGLALFFDNSLTTGSGDTLQLPSITGACSFSGSLTAFPEPGGPSSGQVVTDSAQGNVTPSSSITGTFSGNASGTFSATPISPIDAVTTVTGQMGGEVQGSLNGVPLLFSLNFTQSGSNNSAAFTTAVVGERDCSVAGTFTEQGTSNVFDVSITFTGTQCGIAAGTLTGIGFESSSDYFNFTGGATGTYLYADILASSNTFVMEFFPLGG
jgi:hypothetical protein